MPHWQSRTGGGHRTPGCGGGRERKGGGEGEREGEREGGRERERERERGRDRGKEGGGRNKKRIV